MGKEGGGRRRARAPGHARKRAQAQPPLPDRLALPPLSGKSSRPDTPESNGEGDWAFWLSIRPVSLPLAAGEKAGRPSSARACETPRHRGRRDWRRPGPWPLASGPREPSPLPPPPPPPPPPSASPPPALPPWPRLCGVGRSWSSVSSCSAHCLNLTPRGRIQRNLAPQPFGPQPGRFPSPCFRGRTPLTPTSGGRNLGFFLLLLGSAARKGSLST